MTGNVSSRWTELLGLIPGYDCFATADDGDYFDESIADNRVRFIETCLTHIEGQLSGQPFKLQPWQKAFVGCLFGWQRMHATANRPVRRYRECFFYAPRKQGKTPLSASVANTVMYLDDEKGAQGYCLAGERDQAALLFRHCKGQIENDETLSSRSRIYGGQAGLQKRIVYLDDNGVEYGFLVVQSADADTKHGGNSHLVLIDELHVQKSRDLVDTMRTSFASENRIQPLLMYMTTADYEGPSICNEIYDNACKIRDGIIHDPRFLPVIYEAKQGDKWTDPVTWKKANPNLGVSVSLEYLERECKRAQETPSYENTFKRLHLNMQTQQDVRWLSLDQWDGCDSTPVTMADFAGKKVFAGLDLSTTTDLSALVLAAKAGDGSILLLPHFWCPAESIEKRERRDRVPYQTWQRQGLITMTAGSVIDYAFIRQRIGEIHKAVKITEIAYDDYNALHLIQELQDDGLGKYLVQFPQNYKAINAPSKEFEKLVASGMLRHGGNPILRWMAGNVCIATDPQGNIKPVKGRSTERIDGIVAAIMAIGRIMVQPQVRSVYQTRGVIRV